VEYATRTVTSPAGRRSFPSSETVAETLPSVSSSRIALKAESEVMPSRPFPNEGLRSGRGRPDVTIDHASQWRAELQPSRGRCLPRLGRCQAAPEPGLINLQGGGSRIRFDAGRITS